MGSSSSNLDQDILRRFRRKTVSLAQATKAALAALLILLALPSLAAAQTKALKLYYLHTGEKAEIVFKRNGRFDKAGLKKINWFLRDWRRNEPTKMDPNLLDLIWEVYRKTGSRKHIHVISGYRAPASNELLRKRGRGVAKNSQHTRGRALDFFIPGVKLSKLREIGLKMQVGGVGYYPKSGSPFVHMDTGNVRHWPRMSRSQLARVFPDGKTMHVPSDGKPLARYKQAVAEYKRRAAKGKLVPQSKPTVKELNFFQRLARATREDEADDKDVAAPAPRPVTTTKPAAQPQPPAPAPTEPEQPQFAALPSAIPVPVVAPRQSAISTGTPVVAQTPLPQAEQTPLEEPAEAETPSPEQEAETATVFAEAGAPVPEKRPEVNPVIAMTAAIPQASPSVATAELAMLPPAESPAAEQSAQPLSPAEIEALRKVVRPQTTQSPALSAINDRPVPATSVGNTPEPAEPVAPPAPAIVERQPLPEADRQPVVLAQSEPVETPQAAEPPVEETQPETIELAALPIEPGVESTGAVAIPGRNPAVSDAAESNAQPEGAAEEGILAAALPVPEPAPRPRAAEPAAEANDAVMMTAALDAGKAEEAPEVTPSPDLQQRPVSLDSLSAPQENSNVIGKWALSATTTINDLADVQAPAYGRNLIRQVPNAVIVQQFNLQAFGPGQNRFNGKAVKAMKFARLQ